MKFDPSDMILNDKPMRIIFAVAAAIIGAGTILTRNEDAVDWSLVAPTVVVYSLWAAFDGFPRWPLYVLGFGAPIAMNIVESNNEVSMFLVVLTVAILASMETDRATVVSLILIIMTAVMVLGLTGAVTEFAWPNWLFGIAFSWGFGELAYRYRYTIDELEVARELVSDQAAVQERRRIARDVHDLVGHSLSVVMLHVTGARHLVHKDPDEAERALIQAEVAGRESLAEIRRTVGMLRDDNDSAAAALPSPDLSDVADLVDEYVLGGVSIALDIVGDPLAAEGAAALAGYRIIQEALTNASRHTVDAHVHVSLEIGKRDYELVVRNSGGVVVDLKKGSGFGLISMRERAKSVGGLLVAGPTPDGWTVEATLPLASVEAVI